MTPEERLRALVASNPALQSFLTHLAVKGVMSENEQGSSCETKVLSSALLAVYLAANPSSVSWDDGVIARFGVELLRGPQ